MTTSTKDVHSPLAPLIGHFAWHVRRGVGTFLTLEFGTPHLSVREPIVPKAATTPRNRRDLQRRKVFITGEWHLWIQHADWALQTADGSLDSSDDSDSPKDQCLKDLDGQKLLDVDIESSGNVWTLRFDLGATLKVWPAGYEADALWSLHGRDGNTVVCQRSGSITCHESKVGPRPG